MGSKGVVCHSCHRALYPPCDRASSTPCRAVPQQRTQKGREHLWPGWVVGARAVVAGYVHLVKWMGAEVLLPLNARLPPEPGDVSDA